MVHALPFQRQSAAAGLDEDDARFLALERGEDGETVRVWEAERPAVIVGRFGSMPSDVREDACRADGVPVVRRSSGGGTVLVGEGCLLCSLVLDLHDRPALTPVADSYRLILAAMLDALAIPGATRRGLSDLVIGTRKFSGHAQRRGRRALLHHGTLLYGCRPERLGRYLQEPARQPRYRAGRPHAAFVTNVPLSGGECARRLRRIGEHLPARDGMAAVGATRNGERAGLSAPERWR